MELIGFGMSSTLLNLQDKYYEYLAEVLETKLLTIRGYKSVFLEYLLTSYLLEVTKNQFKEVMRRLIYRDNRFLVFKGKRSISDIRIWRDTSQEKVYEISENEYPYFTCETWNLCGRP